MNLSHLASEKLKISEKMRRAATIPTISTVLIPPLDAGGGVAFVGIAGALDIPARLLYTKHRKGAAGQTVVPLVQLQK